MKRAEELSSLTMTHASCDVPGPTESENVCASEERSFTVRSNTAPDCVRRIKNGEHQGEECKRDMQKVDRDAKRKE